MKIAELFVKIGIRGAAKTQEGLKEVKGTLGEVSSNALLAKAGVLSLVYGLERLMTNSAQTGANLLSFNAATGMSIDYLQRMEYAGQKANLSVGEMESSITGLQQTMLKMSQGQGVPAGFAIIANAVKIDPNRIRDTAYMIDKLNEYAKTEKNIDFANDKLMSMGYSLKTIAAARRDAFSAKNMGEAPTYSMAQAENLNKVHAGFFQLYNKFEYAMGRETAKFGPSMIKDLNSVSTSLVKVIDAFGKLGTKIELLKAVGKVFEGWGLIFDGIGSAVDKVNELAGNKGGKASDWLAKSSDKNISEEAELYHWLTTRRDAGGTVKTLLNPNKHGGDKGTKIINNHNTVNANITGVADADEVGHHIKKHFHTTRSRKGSNEVN